MKVSDNRKNMKKIIFLSNTHDTLYYDEVNE